MAVFGLDIFRVFADEIEHAFEIFQVEHEEVLVVGDFEGDVENSFLGFVEFQETGEEEWPHFRDGGSDWVSLLSKKIPEDDGRCAVSIGIEFDDLGAFF